MPPARKVIPNGSILTVATFSCCFLSLISALDVVQQLLDCDQAAVTRKDISGCKWALAYNGHTLSYFDPRADRLIVESSTVKSEVDSLNKDPKALKNIRNEIQDTVNFLSQLLEVGAGTLDRKVPPSVTISFIDLEASGHSSQLQCTVSGFYPRALNVSWLKDGRSTEQYVTQTPILPNNENTFQTTAYIKIEPSTVDTYTCLVEHVTFPQGYRTDWVPRHRSSLSPAAIVGILFGIVGIITAVVGGVVRMKRQGHQSRMIEPKVLFQKCQERRSNRSQSSMRSNASASSATSGDGLTKHTV
nr:MHC class II beta chain like protein [Triakis scyllium]